MKTNLLYDRLAEKWVPAPIESLLIDKPVGDLLSNSSFSSFDSGMLETADGYKLEVAVPGLKKRDLKLEVSDGMITVQGQKQQKSRYGWIRKTVEFKSTLIHKTFVLPKDADADRIKAKCKDGLLRISIPKIKNQRTLRDIPVASVESTGKMSWWEKLARPFKKLKAMLGNL